MHDSQASLQDALENLGWPQVVALDLARSAHILTYDKAATVFHAGEPADLLYVILCGEIKLYYGDADGERLLVAICRRGQMIGSMDLELTTGCDREMPQLFSSETLSRCKLAIITKARVTAAVRDLGAPEILGMLQRVNRDWVRFCSRFLAFMMMDVRSRLTYAINEVADTFGIADPRGRLIPLRLSHEDFGELVGASRPMVSKLLKELAKTGIFYKQNGRYILSPTDQGVLLTENQWALARAARDQQAADAGGLVRKGLRPRSSLRDSVTAVAV